MKKGFWLIGLGVVFVLVGTTALQWQRYEIAEVVARGFEVPLVSQIIILLALLVGLSCAIGVALPRLAKRAAGVSLIGSVFMLAWVVAADVSRHDVLALMHHEAITMGAGYWVALIGSVAALMGALAVLAAGPRWDPARRLLRVALLWNDSVISEKVLYERRDLKIGGLSDNDFVVSGFGDASTILRPTADQDGYELIATPGLSGWVMTDGAGAEVAGRDVDIAPGDWGVVELGRGGSRLFFQFITPEAHARRRGAIGADETLAAAIGASFFTQAAFVVLAVLLWDVDVLRSGAWESARQPSIEANIQMLSEPEIVDLDEVEAQTSSKAADGDEGRFGDEKEPPDKVSKVVTQDSPLRDRAPDPERLGGLHEILSSNSLGGAATAILDQTVRDGIATRIGMAMAGTDEVVAIGSGVPGGMSFRGDGDGGPGEGLGRLVAVGTIDIGGPGVRPMAGLPPKPRRRVTAERAPQPPDFSDLCSKGEIASKVKRRKFAVRSCYEQRLSTGKDLSGKLTVRWRIGLDGKVSGLTAIQDSLGDNAVRNCIFRVLRRLQFTPPEGGFCVVQWPFAFSQR